MGCGSSSGLGDGFVVGEDEEAQRQAALQKSEKKVQSELQDEKEDSAPLAQPPHEGETKATGPPPRAPQASSGGGDQSPVRDAGGGGWSPLRQGAPRSITKNAANSKTSPSKSPNRVAPGQPLSVSPTMARSFSSVKATSPLASSRRSPPPEKSAEVIRPEGRLVKDYGGGDVYEGDWANGKWRHGKGKMVWQNGQSYDGGWVRDRMDGEGEYRWPDGQVYKGEFKNGAREGRGVLQMGDGQTKYVGTFAQNERRGSGVWYLPGGIRRLESGLGL